MGPDRSGMGQGHGKANDIWEREHTVGRSGYIYGTSGTSAEVHHVPQISISNNSSSNTMNSIILGYLS